MIRTQNNAKNWWSGHDQQAGEQVRVKIERESRKWRTVRLAETRSRVTKMAREEIVRKRRRLHANAIEETQCARKRNNFRKE